jgi:hypothetical protein
MKPIWLALAFWFLLGTEKAQVYLEKQTRHRFAQLNLGLDYQTNFGGEIKYLGPNGKINSLALNSFHQHHKVRPYVGISLSSYFFQHQNRNLDFPNGPAVSYETLSFQESFAGQATYDESSQQMAYGLTFGWDIRPNRVQSWILRTNLRWFPRLNLALNDEASVAFANLEFNFIQLVVYPGRMIR